jgi:hypothetical protein
MPTQQSIKGFQHIAVTRLQELATADTTVFTDAEFHHLQTCSTRFKLWRQFIEETSDESDGTNSDAHE